MDPSIRQKDAPRAILQIKLFDSAEHKQSNSCPGDATPKQPVEDDGFAMVDDDDYDLEDLLDEYENGADTQDEFVSVSHEDATTADLDAQGADKYKASRCGSKSSMQTRLTPGRLSIATASSANVHARFSKGFQKARQLLPTRSTA